MPQLPLVHLDSDGEDGEDGEVRVSKTRKQHAKVLLRGQGGFGLDCLFLEIALSNQPD